MPNNNNEPIRIGDIIPQALRDHGLAFIADMLEGDDPRLEEFMRNYNQAEDDRVTNRIHEEELQDDLADKSQAYFSELIEECDADLALLHDHHGDDRVFDETHPNGSYARTR